MQDPPRVAFLDDIRVLLTVLVILHHVAATYGGPGSWYYQEPVTGPGSMLGFTFLMAINQAFFMGFFFFLAGYFAPLSLQRKGSAEFLRDRLLRLGIPLAAFFVLINPLVSWLAYGRWQLDAGPMWFVEVLLLFTLAYVALRPMFPALPDVRIDARSATVLVLVMTLGSFLARIRFPVNHWLEFPDIQPAHATQYVCLFVAGLWLSGRNLAAPPQGLTRSFRRAALLASAAAALAFRSVDVPGDGKVELDAFLGGGTWQSFVLALWEQVICVAMITNLLAWFGASERARGPILTSAAASAYTVYVIHPIVLVALALALRNLDLPSFAKFLIVSPIAVVYLFASADYVRRAPLLRRVL